MHILKHLLPLFILILPFSLIAQEEVLNIESCDGKQHFCASATEFDLCVIIKVIEEELPGEVDYYEIDWGDNSDISIVPGSLNPDPVSHSFDISDFYNTCTYEISFNIFLEVFFKNNADPLNKGFKIYIYNPPKALFTLRPETVCLGDEVLFENRSCPDDGLESMSIDWGDGTPLNAETTHTYTELGTYTIKLTVNSKRNDCGSDTYTRKITVIEPPIARAEPIAGIVMPASEPFIVCLDEESDGQIVTLSGCDSEFGTGYSWRRILGGGNWITKTDTCEVQIRFTSPGTKIIEFSVINECDNPDIIKLEFEVIEANFLEIKSQRDECLTLDYTPSPLNNEATYIVDGDTIKQSDFPINLGLGEHTVMATLSNACGEQLVTDTFNVSPPIDPNILVPQADTIVCVGEPVSLVSDPGNGKWKGEHITKNLLGTEFKTDVPGEYLLIYETGVGDCLRADSVTITVDGVEIALQDHQACPWENYTILNGNPGNGQWSSPDCPDCVSQDTFRIDKLSQGIESVKIIYQITSPNGCVSEDSAYLNILEPVSDFSTVGNLCSNGEIDIDYSGSNGLEFLWRIDGQETSPPPFTNISRGNHNIELVAIIGNCRDSTDITIDVISPPLSADFTVDETTGCPPLEVNVSPSIDSSDDESYSWTFGRFPGDEYLGFDPKGPLEFDNNTDSIATYPIVFSVNNICGETTEEIPINVMPEPKARLGVDSTRTGCSPFKVILTNRSGGLLDSCIWNISDGFHLVSCRDTIHHTFYAHDTIETYTIDITAINECGDSTITDTITVIPPGVKAHFNMEEFNVCAFDSIRFEDASTPIPTSWHWDFGDGKVSSDSNPVHVFTEPEETFDVSLKVSTGCGYDKITHTVTTLPAPKVDFDLPDFGCDGQVITDIRNLSDKNGSYLWEYSDGNVDKNVFEPKPIFSADYNPITIKLTVRTFPDGCSDHAEKTLVVRENPIADFILSDTTGCESLGGVATSTSTNANTLLWQFNGIDKSGATEVGYTFGKEGKHIIKLIASYDDMCVDSLSKSISAEECETYVPNAFTPNNDGNNDYFTVYGTPTIKKVNTLKIYDRWGVLVFEKKDFPPNVEKEGWDGTKSGKKMNSGVFMWLTEVEYFDGTHEFLRGNVTLIK